LALGGEQLSGLVNKTVNGDLSAYGEIVHRFQDMAVGYSYSLLGDFHLAEDAAQEAFIGAYLDLAKLKEPATFPSWFRRIVFKYCDRIRRKKFAPPMVLDIVDEMRSNEKGPDALLEGKELQDQVSTAVQSLPEQQRLVVNLFYIGQFSHKEMAAFLGTSVQTIKNRLHASRKLLKKELIDMARKKLQQQRPSRDPQFVTHIMDELIQLSDAGIQYLLRRIDLEDCILALTGASDEVKEKLLGNMSERVRAFIEEDLGVPPGSRRSRTPASAAQYHDKPAGDQI
jgi:RNA polymerase sigma factor (sigma-70 family)